MKKIRSWFSLRKLRRWTVPMMGFALLMLTMLAWKCVEKSQKAAEERYFYGGYEMVDRCLTAFYNNDAEALLAQFPERFLKTVEERINMNAEAMRTSIQEAMTEAHAKRQASGATYEWEYIGWIEDLSEDDWAIMHEMGMSRDATGSRIQRPILVRLKETVNGVTTEKVLRFLMFELDEQWHTDLPTMPWVGESLFKSGGIQVYQPVRDWVNAWYEGNHRTILEGIPEAVLNVKVGTDRKAWETALMKHLAERAAADREKGTTHECKINGREDLTEQELLSLKQEYKDTCGLEITDVKRIRYTVWEETPPKSDKERPTVTWTSTNCTVVQIDGQWYLDTLHLNAAFSHLWNITGATNK